MQLYLKIILLKTWYILQFFYLILVVVYYYFVCLNHLIYAIDTRIGKATLSDLSFSHFFYKQSYSLNMVFHYKTYYSCCQVLPVLPREQWVGRGSWFSRVFCKCWLKWLAGSLWYAFEPRCMPGYGLIDAAFFFSGLPKHPQRSVSERFLPPTLEVRILQCKCHCWKKHHSFHHVIWITVCREWLVQLAIMLMWEL